MIQKILRREFDIFTDLWSKYQVTEISLLRELFEEIAECTEEEHDHITDHIYAFMLSQCISIEHHFQEIEAAFVHNFAKKMTELIGIQRSEQVSYEPFLKQVETLREASLYRPNKYWIEEFVADNQPLQTGLVLNTISEGRGEMQAEPTLRTHKSGANQILEGTQPKAQIITQVQEMIPRTDRFVANQPKSQVVETKFELTTQKIEPSKTQKAEQAKSQVNAQKTEQVKAVAPAKTEPQKGQGTHSKKEQGKGQVVAAKQPVEVNTLDLKEHGSVTIKKYELSASEVSKILGITVDEGKYPMVNGQSFITKNDFEKLALQLKGDSFHPKADVERLANLKGEYTMSKQDGEKLASLKGESTKLKRIRPSTLDDDPQCIVSDTSSDDEEDSISFATMTGKQFNAKNFTYTVYDFANQSKQW
jgi:hypothetical protein